MSHEIVPADPIDEPSTTYSRRHVVGDERTEDPVHFTRSLTYREHVPEPFDSERLPAALASGIQRFLRVANMVESEEPRIAYLCRFYAFEIVHNMDRNSTGRVVRQFKTYILQRLEQDQETTLLKRKETNDTLALRRVYRTYEEFIIRHGAAFDLENRKKLISARKIASVLDEMLKAVTGAASPQAESVVVVLNCRGMVLGISSG